MKKGQIAIIIASILIIGAGVGVYFIVQNLGTQTTFAPNFTLQSINGTEFTIASLQNKTVLFDFMSVSCIPCKQMYPILSDLQEDVDIMDDIIVISIETDETIVVPQLEVFAGEQNITWTLVIAPSGMVVEYGVVEIPAFIIINPEGEITYAHEGIVSFDELKSELQDAIEGRSSGIQITSYQGFLIGFAIIVAITSFFSPCSFPLLPGYVAHIVGIDLGSKEEEVEEEKHSRRNYILYPLLGLSGGFGILVSYLILGVIISAAGSAILPYIVYVLPVIGGIFIILGILMFTNLEFSFSRLLGWIRKRQMKVDAEDRKHQDLAKIFSTFLYGLGYGIASLGCNGPIFLAFSLQVGAQEAIMKMIFAYLAFALTIIIL
ncbi:MAG: redoxin domain-containing protein, partial [Candidatus Heimdallarchaeaceae archaeon]